MILENIRFFINGINDLLFFLIFIINFNILFIIIFLLFGIVFSLILIKLKINAKDKCIINSLLNLIIDTVLIILIGMNKFDAETIINKELNNKYLIALIFFIIIIFSLSFTIGNNGFFMLLKDNVQINNFRGGQIFSGLLIGLILYILFLNKYENNIKMIVIFFILLIQIITSVISLIFLIIVDKKKYQVLSRIDDENFKYINFYFVYLFFNTVFNAYIITNQSVNISQNKYLIASIDQLPYKLYLELEINKDDIKIIISPVTLFFLYQIGNILGLLLNINSKYKFIISSIKLILLIFVQLRKSLINKIFIFDDVIVLLIYLLIGIIDESTINFILVSFTKQNKNRELKNKIILIVQIFFFLGICIGLVGNELL